MSFFIFRSKLNIIRHIYLLSAKLLFKYVDGNLIIRQCMEFALESHLNIFVHRFKIKYFYLVFFCLFFKTYDTRCRNVLSKHILSEQWLFGFVITWLTRSSIFEWISMQPIHCQQSAATGTVTRNMESVCTKWVILCCSLNEVPCTSTTSQLLTC